MQKAIGVLAGCLLPLLPFLALGQPESTSDYAVQVSARVERSPARIVLEWPIDGCGMPGQFLIHRRTPGASSWIPIAGLGATCSSFADTNVGVGTPYEYQVTKIAAQYKSYGYVYAGIDVPLKEHRGKLLLVVDRTYSAELQTELAQLQQDLAGDGWTVVRLDVNRNDSVIKVKKLIKSQYRADPEDVNCVFLFGHVPVPYSGNIVPDGHAPDHQGAWPCDGYYGDMDGHWTDHSVNTTCATDKRNRNVPADGKFDQSSFPAPLKLMVGRVDLANMPGRLTWGGPPTFPSELELLRNYLHKDHRFRMKEFDLPRRGVVGDYFGPRNGEAFAASGWRNFAAFFGCTNVSVLPKERTWISDLATNQYLWAYGCGPGTYTSIGGLGTANSYNDGLTTELVSHDVKAVFTILFGSWLGDWDAEDDMLRAVLATPSYGLTCAWSGRPHWFLHHMALGEPIGFSARLTQNNGPSGLYQNQSNNGAGQIQIALMGDPTLRMHVVAPPADVTVHTNEEVVAVTWNPSPDPVLGYHVYQARNPDGPYARLNESLVETTSFSVKAPPDGIYMVRAVNREISGSGTYFNASQGAFASPAAIKPSIASAPSKEGHPEKGG